MWHFFKITSLPSHCLSRTPFNLNLIFFQKHILFKIISTQSLQGVCFLVSFHLFYLDYANFSIGFWKLGIFEKGVGVINFVQNVFKILIGFSPIWCVCICVDPMRHSIHVMRNFHSCSCIIHRCCSLLHVRCLTECPTDILVLNWTQVSPFTWDYSWLTMFNMFWSMNVCSTHFVHVMP